MRETFAESDICHRMVSIPTLYSATLTYLFEGKKFQNEIYLKGLELSHKYLGVLCRFWHLSSNGVIAKILLHDLDLLLNIKNLKF